MPTGFVLVPANKKVPRADSVPLLAILKRSVGLPSTVVFTTNAPLIVYFGNGNAQPTVTVVDDNWQYVSLIVPIISGVPPVRSA